MARNGELTKIVHWGRNYFAFAEYASKGELIVSQINNISLAKMWLYSN